MLNLVIIIMTLWLHFGQYPTLIKSILLTGDLTLAQILYIKKCNTPVFTVP